jgi:hypothetical protein
LQPFSQRETPGGNDLIANYESRWNQQESKWMIDKATLFKALAQLKFTPEIDLFATQINKRF